jgi:hypothetical protein
VKENPLRKRKRLKPNWLRLNLESKKSSIKKLQKQSKLPQRRTMASKKSHLRKSF